MRGERIGFVRNPLGQPAASPTCCGTGRRLGKRPLALTRNANDAGLHQRSFRIGTAPIEEVGRNCLTAFFRDGHRHWQWLRALRIQVRKLLRDLLVPREASLVHHRENILLIRGEGLLHLRRIQPLPFGAVLRGSP